MKKMMRIAIAVVVGLLSPAAVAQDPVEWRIEDGGNGHWYARISIDGMNGFDQARQDAVAVGADLASVTSQDEDVFIAALAGGVLGRGVIIGTRVTDPNCDVFTWTDGSAWTYENWGSSPPQPECVPGQAVGYYEDGWHDLLDHDVDAAMFEWSADCNDDGIVDLGQILDGTFADEDGDGVPDCCGAGSPCGLGSVQWRIEDGGNGHWYAEFDAPAGGGPFQGFEGAAVARGGHLASVNSLEEEVFLAPFIEDVRLESGMLIGTQVPGDCVSFTWTDGSEWGFTNWGANQPQCKTGDGVAYYPDGWHDVYDWHVGSYLVEWSADCNDDGIVDHGQILDGTFADEDGDGVPDCCADTACPGDLNGDQRVDSADIGLLIAAWNTDGSIVAGSDIDEDGIVDAADLGLQIGSWGECGGCS